MHMTMTDRWNRYISDQANVYGVEALFSDGQDDVLLVLEPACP